MLTFLFMGERSQRGMGTWGLKGEKELDRERLELHLDTQMQRVGQRARCGAGDGPEYDP